MDLFFIHEPPKKKTIGISYTDWLSTFPKKENGN